MSSRNQASRNKASATHTHFKKSNYPPEFSLWASVMELAINDYTLGMLQGEKRTDFYSAKEWIFNGDIKAMNSFNNICLLFNLDSDSVRGALLNNPILVRIRLAGKSTKG